MWENSDHSSGGTSQIRTFDAFTGSSSCGNTVRISGSVVTPNNGCTPYNWSSVQIIDPAPTAYTSATIDVLTSAGAPVQADTGMAVTNGSVDLSGAGLSGTSPIFGVNFTGATFSPTGVVLRFTWDSPSQLSCTSFPTINSLSPAAGGTAGGVTVTVTGTSFTGTTSMLLGTQTLTPCTGSLSPGCFIVNSDTSITFQTPAAVSGISELSATNPGGVSNSKPFTFAPPQTFTAPPAGTVGGAYTDTVSASGGTSPYTYAVVSGSLPPGLTLNPSSGAITGTPTTPGSYPVVIESTDSASQPGVGSLTFVVNPAPSIPGTAIPAATAGAPYSHALGGGGGTSPLTYSVTSGSLPPGVTLDPSTGMLSGTPTTPGAYDAVVTITDGNGQMATRNIHQVVNPAPVLQVADPAPITPGTPYSAPMAPTGGTAPYSYTVVAGSLPPGLQLDPTTGQVTGTSTLPGTYSVTVEVTDANGQSAEQAVSFTVQPSALNSRTIASTPDGQGYWLATPTGQVRTYGDAPSFGSMSGQALTAPVVGIASTPDGKGYWMVGSDGGVFAFGDAGFYGSAGGSPLAKPVVGLAATPDGQGYWLTASDGGVFAYGDAGFYGSATGSTLNGPVFGLAATPDGKGYWLTAADGGVFAFGDASFVGSMAGRSLNQQVTGMAATPDGHGYWLAAKDGGVFAFGDAVFHGSMAASALNKPVTGILSSPSGNGYWLAAGDGGVFAFGDAAYTGSLFGAAING